MGAHGTAGARGGAHHSDPRPSCKPLDCKLLNGMEFALPSWNGANVDRIWLKCFQYLSLLIIVIFYYDN
jgi:hypothetical protein